MHNCSSRIKPTIKSDWWLLPSATLGMSPICFNWVTEWGSWVPASLLLMGSHRHQEAQPPLLPAGAPCQLRHSAALKLCQAEEGTPVCMTCQEPCWGPSGCSAAEFRFCPRCCSLSVLSCGCQHLHPVTLCCCGIPCSSSRVSGSWKGHSKSLAGYPNTQPRVKARQMAQAGWPPLPQTLSHSQLSDPPAHPHF